VNRHSEQGAVLLTVAISLLVLLGFSAIALDLGMGYLHRRATQNAADAAALAAAWEACNPVGASADPVGAARQAAADNGFDDASPTVSVTVDDLGSGSYRVRVATVEQTTFGAAQPIGSDSLTVASEATARCSAIPFLGGYALFAQGPSSCSGGVELDLSGASKIINGGLHSNGDIKVTGSSTTINGDVTSMGDSNYTPSTQLYGDPIEYPLNLTIEELRPGGSRANAAAADGAYFSSSEEIDNTWMINQGHATGSGGSITITRSGIYYTTGDINLNSASTAPGVKMTFVAEGQISVHGSGDFTAYEPLIGTGTDPGLLMFSNYLAPVDEGPTCTGNAIQWSVSSGTWTGVIYAPHGQARQSSASSATLNGSIFAYTVNLSGSDFEITWHDNPDGVEDFELELTA
jgi:Flp pilus assembly protein TadG